MVILIGIGVWALSGINKNLERIVHINNEKERYAFIIKDSINLIDKSVLTIISANDNKIKNEENAKVANLRKIYNDSLEKAEKLEQNKKGLELIKNFREIAVHVGILTIGQ